ncbi:TLC domain-containing protein [Boletus edulis BED1]|uniref:TLC domain-containing protein n=1 Tax=Boletus edulis BED1 TaxID=1328754 RepID=A0AAD4C7Y1_BOLED|nr:TLC domain-containing protein [Boletus edulis BED1]
MTLPQPGLWSDLKSSRWVVNPASSFKLLLVPLVFYINWEVLAPFVAQGLQNPFRPFFFISYPISSSPDSDPRYRKGYLDLVFLAYHIVLFSFVRQIITINICHPIARYFGLKSRAKRDRFGEQGYAFVYFAVMGAWGFRIMSQLPTYWYKTEHFFHGYPHWDMLPDLKQYYLVHFAYWCQQLIVLLLRLEKPRKDHNELVVHHIVTILLVGGSYLLNMTLIGNAVFMSMDIPDVFLAISKILNYLQLTHAKLVAFIVFLCIWTYFRHYLNIVMLWSVWYQYDLVPEANRVWRPEAGVWLVWWMKHQIFLLLLMLQILNLFWYYLILRIALRSLKPSTMTDDRSDDEDDGDANGHIDHEKDD